jgi:uncharacterized membrane protein
VETILRKDNAMKRAITIVTMLTLTGVVACSMSSRGGGVSKDEGFKIAVPGMDTVVKQGELQTVTISLHRGENFKRDVKLEIKSSKGISVEPSSVLVKGSDAPDVQLRITASTDADLGEYRVYVKGTPEAGEATSVDFKVKVVAP